MISPPTSKDIDVYKSGAIGDEGEENKAKLNGGHFGQSVGWSRSNV